MALYNMRFWLIAALAVFAGTSASAQFTIELCQERAQINFPQIKQYDLIAQSEQFNLRNASKAYLPQFSLSLKATYQTEVVEFPLSMPGLSLPSLPKDQYQAVAEVNQLIWDGGVVRTQKKRIAAEHAVEAGRHAVEMYELRERVNNLFFGILLLEEQLKLNAVYDEELQANRVKVEGAMRNGVANRNDLDALTVEQIANGQRRMELEAARLAYSDMLACFIGEPLGSDPVLKKPSVTNASPAYPLLHETSLWEYRPEVAYFQANMHQLETQRKQINANNLPKLSAFLQGGYGNPGLNMLKEGFRAYAIGGLRLTWNFGGLYTRKDELRKIGNAISRVEIQRQAFDFNTRLKYVQQHTEIEKYRKIVKDDERIVELRERIKEASESKVENGTMTVTDLVRDLSNVQQARATKALHEIEMLRSVYQLKNTLNN